MPVKALGFRLRPYEIQAAIGRKLGAKAVSRLKPAPTYRKAWGSASAGPLRRSPPVAWLLRQRYNHPALDQFVELRGWVGLSFGLQAP
jgi:hypothetical protein